MNTIDNLVGNLEDQTETKIKIEKKQKQKKIE